MKVVTGTYHVVGSGTAWAWLIIDGERVKGNIDMGNNGFVGWIATDVPVERLRKAKEVEWEQGAYPGQVNAYVGSGKGFIRRMVKKDRPRDPLTVPLRQRPYVQELENKRLADKLIEEIGRGELRLDSKITCYRQFPDFYRKVTQRADRGPNKGCIVTQWERIVGLGNSFGHRGQQWKRVMDYAIGINIHKENKYA